MSLCFRFFDLYSCDTRERACVHSVLEERVNGSTQRIRDPFMLLFPFSTLFILVLAPFFSISRRSSSSSYFYLFSSVHRQVRARWPRCGIAWKSESRVSLRKTFYFLFLLYSPTRGENLRNLHTLEIPIFISFYFILFYFTLFYFFFIFFLFFVCFMMRAERFVEARHLRADTISCCFHADVLRLPSSSASVDSVAASPMSPRGYLLRDGGCWSAATPSSFFFFFLVVERAITWWTSSPSTWLCCRVPDCSIPSFRCSVSPPVDRSRCSRNGDTSPGASGCRSAAGPRRRCSALAAPCYGSLFRALASPDSPENCRRVLEALFATARRRNCYTANFLNHGITAKKCV